MDSILEVESLVKVYGKDESAVKAVNNASFQVNRGEFVLVVGSSGSGKSTLLNLMGLLDKPTSGMVRIDGVDTTTMNDVRPPRSGTASWASYSSSPTC